MAMDLSRKGASGERKMLGIPIVSLAVIAAVFMCVVYYASGYASENTKLIEKYGIARTKILSLSRMVEKMSSNQKICQSNLGQNEQSNKELTLQVSRCKSAKEEEETKSKQCQSQITTFQRFYSAVKEKLNHGENGEVTATVDTKSDLDNTIDGIVKLNAKISKLEEDQSKCSEVEKEFEELKRSTETTNSQIKALATEKEALNDELKNVRKLLEEANAKISNFDDHQHKRSFQRKKIPEQDRNVKEEILNEKKEQPKPVNHESGVVDSLNKASSVSGNNSASSVVHKAINVTSSDARNTTPTEADSEQTTTNTSTSFTKTNTSTASPELTTTTKKALVTEEDDDLEGGFNDTAGEKNSKTTTAPSKQTIKSTLNLNRTLSTSFNNSDNKMTVKANASVSSSIRGETVGNSTEKKTHSVIDANVRPDILSRESENKENNEKVIEKKGDDNFIDFNERPDITNKEKEKKNSLNVEKITDVDLDELDQA